MNRATWWRVALATALVAACGDPVQPAEHGGSIDLEYLAPDDSTGIVIFTITGAVDSVTAPAGLALYTDRDSAAGRTRVLVAGAIESPEVVARVFVPGVTAAYSYPTVVEQAAKRGTFVQQPIAVLHIVPLLPD